MTKTVIITLKRSFINLAREDQVALPTAIKETKAADTFKLTFPQFKEIYDYAKMLSTYEDAGNKLVAANTRRAGKSAFDTMFDAKPVIEKAKKPAKAKKAKPAPVAVEDRPDPASDVTPQVVYDTLHAAFDHFNATLFAGKLPPVMLLLHRKKNAHGYFWQDKWQHGEDKDARISEIALNPETMGRTQKEVLSTLVHEMVHHEQHVFGKPSKIGHNVEWCEWMERIDLTPVGVGNCEGKRSGRNFTHEIVEGGAFDKACDAFLATDDVDMAFFSNRSFTAKKQDYSKVKHTCGCGCNIWGKYNPETGTGISAVCDDCGTAFEPKFYV